MDCRLEIVCVWLGFGVYVPYGRPLHVVAVCDASRSIAGCVVLARVVAA